MKFNIVFESTKSQGYVGVLADTQSPLVTGRLAAQDAGSSNIGIYYQVGGGGVNGHFATALGTSLQSSVNNVLVTAYDARFGQGAWKKDQSSGAPPLTSFYIPLPANASDLGVNVGKQVAGMVYSVGPVISVAKIPRPDQYRQIYVDALNSIADANKNAGLQNAARIDGLRLTMVSTGIFGPSDPHDATAVRREAAGLILEAIAAAASGPDAAQLPATILINCKIDSKKSPASDEIDAFTSAAKARNITVTHAGFEFDTAAASAAAAG